MNAETVSIKLWGTEAFDKFVLITASGITIFCVHTHKQLKLLDEFNLKPPFAFKSAAIVLHSVTFTLP